MYVFLFFFGLPALHSGSSFQMVIVFDDLSVYCFGYRVDAAERRVFIKFHCLRHILCGDPMYGFIFFIFR